MGVEAEAGAGAGAAEGAVGWAMGAEGAGAEDAAEGGMWGICAGTGAAGAVAAGLVSNTKVCGWATHHPITRDPRQCIPCCTTDSHQHLTYWDMQRTGK